MTLAELVANMRHTLSHYKDELLTTSPVLAVSTRCKVVTQPGVIGSEWMTPCCHHFHKGSGPGAAAFVGVDDDVSKQKG